MFDDSTKQNNPHTGGTNTPRYPNSDSLTAPAPKPDTCKTAPKADIVIDPLAKAMEAIKKKEARIAEAKSLLQKRVRRARNGQLFVWGAMIEAAYTRGSDSDRATVRAWAAEYLTDKSHKERSEIGLFRLDKERETKAAAE